jgi:hypothetical protein
VHTSLWCPPDAQGPWLDYLKHFTFLDFTLADATFLNKEEKPNKVLTLPAEALPTQYKECATLEAGI